MEWIDSLINPPKLNKMLVHCNKCKNIHSVHWDYGEYCLAEACYESGRFFTGEGVDFRWYMPLPTLPTSEECPTA